MKKRIGWIPYCVKAEPGNEDYLGPWLAWITVEKKDVKFTGPNFKILPVWIDVPRKP